MEALKLSVNTPTMPVAHIGGGRYFLGELTQFHFLIRNDGRIENATTYDTQLVNHFGDAIQFKVRTRVLDDGIVNCRFSDLPLTDRNKLEQWIRILEDPDGGGDSLNRLSYDEIARGETGSSEKELSETAAKPDSRIKNSMPIIVFLGIILLILAILVTIYTLAKTRNQIKINHGSLIGNYLPIQATGTGIIEECLFTEGDMVKKGDVIFRLGSGEIEEEATMAKAAMASARAEVTALEQMIASQKRKFAVVVKNSEQKIIMAKALQEKAIVEFESQQKIVNTLSPLVKRQVFPQLDYQREVSVLKTMEAEKAVQRALVSQAVSELDAMVEGEFFIMGENIDDELNQLRARLGIAKAAVNETDAQLHATMRKQQLLNVRAPRGGKIFSVYRSPGEYVKLADPVVSMSVSDRSWAFGSVLQSDAQRIRPGQTVRVEVPALNTEVIGRIASVGHRSVYTEGGWSQDFKVDPLSIPIKVWLPEIPHSPPTGIRLKMMVKLPFLWPWEDEEVYDPNSVKRDFAESAG